MKNNSIFGRSCSQKVKTSCRPSLIFGMLVDLGITISELESINYVVSNLLKLAVLQHIKADVWEKKLVFFYQELKVFVGTKGGK
jgi:hypothetical protein